jgi:hydrogenase/urease accessory protein HupE
VKGEDQLVSPSISDISIQQRSSTPYLYMRLDYELPSDAKSYSIDYGFFYDNDPNHQNYVTIRKGGSSKDIIFTRDNHEITNRLDNQEADNRTTVEVPNWIVTMWDYVVVGIEHILGGFDHLLFILALVLVQQKKWNYLKVLTAFTAGHSLTIALAALEIVKLSAAFVEPVIALSIAYVAVENIWLKEVKWRWIVALLFGLIHGFGFAQVLQGALGDRFLLTLFSFNLGVELGQIAVLVVLLPLLLWAGRYKGYKYMNYGVSGLITLIALYWFVTRIIEG